MTPRRIVTGVVDGRSTCIADDTDGGANAGFWRELWQTTAAAPLGAEPAAGTATTADLAPGATALRLIELPPYRVLLEALAKLNADGFDSEGFHRTTTLDYVLMLDGPVELALEDGSVQVNAGDIVVQRSTMHTWRNHNDHPVRMLAVMVGVPPEATPD